MKNGMVIKETRHSRADPAMLASLDVTGRQRPTRPRQPTPVRHDELRQAEIKTWATRAYPTHDLILSCRSATWQAAADKAARMRGGDGQTSPKGWRERWRIYLLQTGSTRLTTAQKRAIRRRLTRAELAKLTDRDRRALGVTL